MTSPPRWPCRMTWAPLIFWISKKRAGGGRAQPEQSPPHGGLQRVTRGTKRFVRGGAAPPASKMAALTPTPSPFQEGLQKEPKKPGPWLVLWGGCSRGGAFRASKSVKSSRLFMPFAPFRGWASWAPKLDSCSSDNPWNPSWGLLERGGWRASVAWPERRGLGGEAGWLAGGAAQASSCPPLLPARRPLTQIPASIYSLAGGPPCSRVQQPHVPQLRSAPILPLSCQAGSPSLLPAKEALAWPLPPRNPLKPLFSLVCWLGNK